MKAKRWLTLVLFLVVALPLVGYFAYVAGYYRGYNEGYVSAVQVRSVEQFGEAVKALVDGNE